MPSRTRTDYEYFEQLGHYDPTVRKRGHAASYARRYARLPPLPEGEITIDGVVARSVPYRLLTRVNPDLFPNGSDPVLDWIADDEPYPTVILAHGEAFRVPSDFWFFLENEVKGRLPGQVRIRIDETRRYKNLYTADWPRQLANATRGDLSNVLPPRPPSGR